MIITGFIKVDLVNYPGLVCATVFTQGCNLRCPYCHNYELIAYKPACHSVNENEVLLYLMKRHRFIDGVVVSGGEPTLQSGLKEFLFKVKELGFKVKLDTNGTKPDVISDLISEELVDYIAMDIKIPLNKYHLLSPTESEMVSSDILKSISVIDCSGIEHEYRTTCVRKLLNYNDFRELWKLTANSKWYLQVFNPHNSLASLSSEDAYSERELAELICNLNFKNAVIR